VNKDEYFIRKAEEMELEKEDRIRRVIDNLNKKASRAKSNKSLSSDGMVSHKIPYNLRPIPGDPMLEIDTPLRVIDKDDEGNSWEASYRLNGADPTYEST